MDEYDEWNREVMFSTFSKSMQINPYVTNTTIGLNRSTINDTVRQVTLKNAGVQTTVSLPYLGETPNLTILINQVQTEFEQKRQKEVENDINRRINYISQFCKNKQADTNKNFREKQRDIINRRNREELLILEELEKNNTYTSAQDQSHYEELAERRKKIDRELIEYEKCKAIKNFILKIQKDQAEFSQIYKNVVSSLKGCKFRQQLIKALGNIHNELPCLINELDQIIVKCKNGVVTEKESSQSSQLVKTIKALSETVKQKILEVNQEEEEKEKEKEISEKAVPKHNVDTVTVPSDIKSTQIDKFISKTSLHTYSELQQFLDNFTHSYEDLLKDEKMKNFKFSCKIAINIPVNAISAVNSQHLLDKYTKLPNLLQGKTVDVGDTQVPSDIKSTQIFKFISKTSLHTYSELQQFLDNFTHSYEDLLKDEKMKNFKFSCKIAINIPVNAISAVNSQHLPDKYTKLPNLLQGKTVDVGDTQVCAAQHPQGVAFCQNLLEKFLLQGDLMISSKPEASFCYAAIISALWYDNENFGKLFLAHLHKQCPYLVPMYPPRAIGQSDKEYYISLGYQCTDNIIEKQDKFLKRMTGIMRLYAAVIITKPKRGQLRNLHGIREGWRWLSSFLNMEPKPDITATLLHVFFKITGSTMQNVYGKVFIKLMQFVCQVYLPMIQKIDTGGPVTRLEVLLQDYVKHGRFDETQGIFPSNFW